MVIAFAVNKFFSSSSHVPSTKVQSSSKFSHNSFWSTKRTSIRLFALLMILAMSEPTETHIQQHTSENALAAPVLHHHKKTVESISSHVLDTAAGNPAAGAKMFDFFPNFQSSPSFWWRSQSANESGKKSPNETDKKGRVENVHPGWELRPGTYKLRFLTKQYFKKQGQDTFFPYVDVVFSVEDIYQHYHVPLTVSNYGYSTYRGQ